MPTIVREGRFRIRVLGPPREPPPPHVHVEKDAEGLVVIRLRIGDRPLLVWQVFNLRNDDVVAAYRLVEKHHDTLMAAWRSIHGQV
jgi:hypothetical protein